MNLHLRRALFLLLLGAALLPLCNANQVAFLRFPDFDILEQRPVRAGFSASSEYGKETTLLQVDGNVDVVRVFYLDMPLGVGDQDVEFIQSSSNENVLKVSGNGNLLASSSSSGAMNVSCTLSFDEMVGKTEYTLKALRKDTGETIAAITVPFIIAGMTFYQEAIPGNVTVVSGEERKYSIDYERAKRKSISDSDKIHVHIQYPDGSSTSGALGGPVRHRESLQISESGKGVEYTHNSTQCDSTTLGTYTELKGLSLPVGCGYGFYSDVDGGLRFGVAYNPYRVGNFTFKFSWTGLTSGNSLLSEEIFEVPLNIFITGTPSVAILDVIPNNQLLRPEGGEIVMLEVINSEWRPISSFRLSVKNATAPYHVLPGSYEQLGAPNYTQRVSFLTQAGSGTNLTWSLEYQQGERNSENVAEPNVFHEAVFAPGLLSAFSYDDQALRIDSMSPNFAASDGGAEATILGYFSSFDADVDGVFFSGKKLDRKYISSASSERIAITVPPNSELGYSFEFQATVRIGNGASNPVVFSFAAKDVGVRISLSGTSEISDDVYKVGECTPVRFTAIVQPYTSHVQSYSWVLYLAGGSTEELFKSSDFTYVNPHAQTIEVFPHSFNQSVYTLRVQVVLLDETIHKEISLLREPTVSIGAFILEPQPRMIYTPDAPLRLSAVVEPPGSCYTGNQTMVFEWEAFGKTQRFSSANATGLPTDANFTTAPTRLGWEFVIQREQLVHGTHIVTFKAWMEADEQVFGYAKTKVIIKEAPLVAVIRSGERRIQVNRRSNINISGTKSYDPDVIHGDKTSSITYEWLCHEALSDTFSSNEAAPCGPALLPHDTAADFTIAAGVLETFPDIHYVQYTLVVRKGNRVSTAKKFVVEIQDRGVLPFLTDYSFTLTKADGTVQDVSNVAHYEQCILSVEAPLGVSWVYELMDPSEPDFFSAAKLIQNPTFFSLEASLYNVSGNRKPLGIEGERLKPFTTYAFKIKFDGSSEYEATSVMLSLRTSESPMVGFPVPPMLTGTTSTKFTVNAGIPTRANIFSYYFMLSGSDGNKFCVGGCTGYDVVHFQVGKPGTYRLSVLIFDMQGKALLDSQTLSRNITVTASETQGGIQSQLAILFENGNDNEWTQLAHDTALILLEPQLSSAQTRTLASVSGREETTREDVLAYRMEVALNISRGSRKIFCSSLPNTYHGINGMLLTSLLMKQSMLDAEAMYNCMIAVGCCNRNTPPRTMNSMGPQFPSFLGDLNRLAKNLNHGGNSRRRLLQTSYEPANLLADVQTWTAEPLTASIVSGKLGGFSLQLPIGEDGKYGEYSVIVASNGAHIPDKVVNGQSRKVVMGPSDDELFYVRDTCLLGLFAATGNQKRFLVLHTMDNFLLYGFQDPPLGSNLADKLYWAKVYEENIDGSLAPIEIPRAETCFCWRLPVLRRRQFLEESVEFMPGMFSVANMKRFGVDVTAKGEAYTYVYEGMKTSEYNATEGWVEACHNQVGIASSTVVTKRASNAIAQTNVTILGTGGVALVGMLVGGLLLVVVAMASSWLLATRAMSGIAAQIVVEADDLYVERDVYGRGTIFDINAESEPTGE